MDAKQRPEALAQSVEAEEAEVSEDEFEGDEESGETGLTEEPGIAQRPARMTSPDLSEAERTAVDDLVEQGTARERAEELVKQHGTSVETLKAELA